MSFKKTLALCLSLLILGGCAITGTLAFPSFLSADPAPEQQMQKLEIKLNVVEEKEAFLVPAVPFKKAVSISSTENSNVNAYVWYTYAVPKALLGEVGKCPLTRQFATDTGWKYGAEGKEIPYDDMEYVEFTCLYEKPLEPKNSTGVSMQSVTLDARISRDENGNYVWVEDGKSETIGYKEDTIEIPFHAYAIVATGFDSVDAAYVAYNNNSNSPTAEATAD